MGRLTLTICCRLRSSSARSSASAHPRQDRRLEKEGDVDGRHPATRLQSAGRQASCGRERLRSFAPFSPLCRTGSVRLVKDELEARAIKSNSWTTASGRRVGGKSFSRGALPDPTEPPLRDWGQGSLCTRIVLASEASSI